MEKNDDKDTKKLDSLMTSLDKKYGKGLVQVGDSIRRQHIDRWVLDSPNINYVLGGGVPKGRIIEIFGAESGGKTSLATFMAAQIQKQGGKIAVVDAEHSFDLDYAKTLGLDVKETILSQPGSGEEALGITEDIVKSGLVDFIIIDSVAALTPQAEIEGEMGDQQMGQQARLMGKALRKISPICGSTNTTLCFINQIRMKIGISFGNPETVSGGKALAFWSSIRLDVRKADYLKQGEEIIGIKSRIKGTKNKTAPPFRKVEIDIIFGKGIQYHQEYVDHAIKYDLIDKSASWFSILDDDGKQIERIQGKEKVINYMKDNPEYFNSLMEKVNGAIQNENKSFEETNDDGEEKGEKQDNSTS